jgi:hypothetical protein
VSLQHARVAAPLVLAGAAKVHGARDVCGAAVVLAARVDQQQRVGINSPAGGSSGRNKAPSYIERNQINDQQQRVSVNSPAGEVPRGTQR